MLVVLEEASVNKRTLATPKSAKDKRRTIQVYLRTRFRILVIGSNSQDSYEHKLFMKENEWSRFIWSSGIQRMGK